ncbi:MAG: hypothetical protein ABIH42_02760 [Planctomycetota bacterium]
MAEHLPQRQPNASKFLLYQTEDGKSLIEVRLEGISVWLPQSLMAELFQTTSPTFADRCGTWAKLYGNDFCECLFSRHFPKFSESIRGRDTISAQNSGMKWLK